MAIQRSRARQTAGPSRKLLKAKVLAVVAQIPQARVTTYGAIARCLRVGPREVAYVMARLTPEESAEFPWYRVVAAKGIISTMKLGQVGRRQIARLRDEGVTVTLRHKVAAFDTVFWPPKRVKVAG
jgi:methylated-DNA-protein-cysteine methyltransferase related protein